MFTPDLMVTLRRPAAGGQLRGLVAPSGSTLRASLLLSPAALLGTLGTLGALAVRLPGVVLTAAQKASRRKLSGTLVGVSLRNYAHCVSAVPAVLGQADGGGWPSAASMMQLADLMDSYGGITRYAQQGVARAMDLRLMVGAFQWFLLKQVMDAVVARLEAAATPVSERSKLQNAFSGLLLRKEQLLMDGEQRRAAQAAKGLELDAQLVDAGRRASLLDTIHAIRMNLPVDPSVLEEAAAYYAEQQKKQPAVAGTAAVAPAAAAVKTGGNLRKPGR